ncbi:MAG: hypothetical protein L0Y71_06910 [Gemmataceae bacterium]|nr:hypothetical protein [Gemmataceae bacterium]
MTTSRWSLGVACLLAGCQPLQLFEEPKTATVSSNPFGLHESRRAGKVNYQPADEALALKVDSVGRKLLAANQELGLKTTLFAAIGNTPRPEIFHTGPRMVWVTDGLVRRCATEGELAAVLALELGKIVADREAAATPQMRDPDRLPPIQVPIGNAGHVTNPDLVHQVELANFEKERPKKRRPLPRPDPQHLARGYLEKAGYRAADLDTVQPLLQAAEQNLTLERQFNGMVMPDPWTR